MFPAGGKPGAMQNTQVPPHAQVMDLVSGKIISRAVSLAADLSLADRLSGGARPASDLARESGVEPDALERLMQTLESVGVFQRTSDGLYENSELSHTLRADHPQSVRAFARWFGAELHWDIWGDLDYSVRTGKPAFTRHDPEAHCFGVLAEHPETQAIFLEAMTGFTNSEAAVMVEHYDFGRYRTLMDVGGAHGALSVAIKRRFPALEIVLFDQPHVVEGAQAAREADIKLQGGDFFHPIPGSVDCCLLKHIIHDWDDERAALILKNCGSALNPDGEILVCEMLVHHGPGSHVVKSLDLEMLVAAGGRERNEEQFAALFARAGLELVRVERTPSPLAMMVGRVRP